MANYRYVQVRSVFDRVAAAVLLVLLSPLLACVCGALVATMGRPIFFRQERVGRFWRPFHIPKLRTMASNAEILGEGYALHELNLITPLGKVLRSLSLDELPQLVNILKGEMVFVGPRPALK